MKRFISINMRWALALIINCQLLIVNSSSACAWVESNNYYLFSVYNRQCFQERANNICNKNWQAYLGDKNDYYYFNADEVINFSRNKGDLLMASYVKYLQQYLDVCRDMSGDQWDYPSKEELQQRRTTLNTISNYAQSKMKSKMRSQYTLLFMRCQMVLGQYDTIISTWANGASNYIETIYKEMMKDIYAGALVKKGRRVEGSQIFAELEDWESLMTVYYEGRSFDAIKKEYQRDPNSTVLPFLLQDFVNNTQEAVDLSNGDHIQGKLFIRDISMSEAQNMCLFAESVVREGKTENPALWKSAQAWIRFLTGSKRQAKRDIDEAVTMKGPPRIEDNARAIQHFITASQMEVGDAFDDYVLKTIAWLNQKNEEEKVAYPESWGHYNNVYHRLKDQVLLPKYKASGQMVSYLGLASCYNMPQADGTDHTEYAIALLENMPVDQFISLIGSLKSSPKTKMERFITKQVKLNEDKTNDMIGTKLMRACRWEEAIEYFSMVPISFYNNSAYATYVAYRNWTVEPWITRQWIKESLVYGQNDYHFDSCFKINFAREMMQMEQAIGYQAAQPEPELNTKDYQKCYDLAVRYAQADFTGDCWYLMHDTKSCDGSSESISPGEIDLKAHCRQLLSYASLSKDVQLRERALFGLCYYYLNLDQPWASGNWDYNLNEWVTTINKDSRQYQAWQKLNQFEKGRTPAPYVSRCDNYLQFIKSLK